MLPLNGTREGLFSRLFPLLPRSQDRRAKPIVAMPNPFYQCYAAAALASGRRAALCARHRGERLSARLCGACRKRSWSGWPRSISARPPIPKARWPSEDYWRQLFALADRYDFMVLADECYADIYFDQPPVCALPARLKQSGGFTRLLTFHSLSKRSGLPGLRSGHGGGRCGADRAVPRLPQCRGAAGAGAHPGRFAPPPGATKPMSPPIAPLYAEKMAAAERDAGQPHRFRGPAGGFFLWLDVGNGEETALRLWREGGSGCCPAPIWAGKSNREKPSQTLAFPISGWRSLAICQPL